MKQQLVLARYLYGDGSVSGIDSVLKVPEEGLDELSDYVVTSEIIEVDFPELSKQDVNLANIALLDKHIKNEVQESNYRISCLEEQKQKLLALPNPE